MMIGFNLVLFEGTKYQNKTYELYYIPASSKIHLHRKQITPCLYRTQGKVMFSEACVSHSVHRGSPSRGRSSWVDPLPGQRRPGQRPLDRDPLDRDFLDKDPLDKDFSWTETPWTEAPWRKTPLDRDPQKEHGTRQEVTSCTPWKEHGTR